MRIEGMNWMEVEDRVRADDRAVLPVGSTEQHAFLSLATDAILAERVAVEAAEPLGVPVYPVVPYGVAPYFAAFPGTVTLRDETYLALLQDVLASLLGSGFRRILVVNGHGGNAGVLEALRAWAAERPELRLRWHDWWRAPATRRKVDEIDPSGSHANWMETFAWTRLPHVDLPAGPKPVPDLSDRASLTPAELRTRLGDGSFGGAYVRSNEEMDALWRVAVEETRDRLRGDWDAE
jgi:creatinine amidohydrolase